MWHSHSQCFDFIEEKRVYGLHVCLSTLSLPVSVKLFFDIVHRDLTG